METVDASSTSRDEEDGILIAGLVKEAALLFQSRRFTECIHVLNQLLQKKQDDPKVLHNTVVAEYFRDGCSDPKKLLEVLNEVKKRSEDLAHTVREQAEDGRDDKATGSNESNTIPHQSSNANEPGIVFRNEFDTSIATLNTAVVLFHLHEYAKALDLLERLYQNIESLDETSALHICLLFLDVALATEDVTRAADVIQYLERAIGVGYLTGQGENVSSSNHQASNLPVKASLAQSNSFATNTSNLDSIAVANPSENRARTSSNDAFAYDSAWDTGGLNLARPIGLLSANNLLRTSSQPGPAVGLKLKLHLYKVRFFLVTKNLKAAKREVKLAMNLARDMDSSIALLLKSQLEYSRGNYPKAIKLLMTSINRREGMPGLFTNNFGCIFHQLKKHHISTVSFSKALESISLLRSKKPLKLSSFSQDKSLLIVYNCGLQYLACRKPLVAAHCFLKASLVFCNRPLLWLRIAECCLLAQEKGLLRSSGASCEQEVGVCVVGKGKWRQIVVEDGYTRNGNLELAEQGDKSFGYDSHTDLSLCFGRQCLINALHLLNDFDLKSSKVGLPSGEVESNQPASFKNSNYKSRVFSVVSTQTTANGDVKDPKGVVNTTLHSSISTYKNICRRENHMIKQAVLADLSYLELNLENPLKALSAANSLLMLPECSKIYTYLCHLYAAEALCILNRPKEAAEHLSIYMVGNNVEYPYSEEDTEKCRVDNTGEYEESSRVFSEGCQSITFLVSAEARGILYVNLATVSALQGDLAQAQLFAKEALSTIPKNWKAVLTSVYIDLMLENSKEALIQLKKCRSVRFLATGVTLKGCS